MLGLRPLEVNRLEVLPPRTFDTVLGLKRKPGRLVVVLLDDEEEELLLSLCLEGLNLDLDRVVVSLTGDWGCLTCLVLVS